MFLAWGAKVDIVAVRTDAKRNDTTRRRVAVSLRVISMAGKALHKQ
jgi:hypothetical protein